MIGIIAAQTIESPIPATGPISPVLILVIITSCDESLEAALCSSIAIVIPCTILPAIPSVLKKLKCLFKASDNDSLVVYNFFKTDTIEAQKIKLWSLS